MISSKQEVDPPMLANDIITNIKHIPKKEKEKPGC